MKLLLLAALLATVACTPNDKTTTTDSTTNNAAAAADTTGAARMMAKDNAGVRLDSAGAKNPEGLGGTSSTGNGVGPASSGAGATSAQGQ